MSEAQPKLTDIAIDTAVAEFIASIETLADRAPVRSALFASAIYKLVHQMAEITPDQHMLISYIEDAAGELRDDLPGHDVESESLWATAARQASGS